MVIQKKRHLHIILNTSQKHFQVATTSQTSGLSENMPDPPLARRFGIRIFIYETGISKVSSSLQYKKAKKFFDGATPYISSFFFTFYHRS